MKKSFLVIIPVFVFLAAFPLQCQKINDGGLYLSKDMGENWEQLSVKEENISITSLSILSLVIDPADSKVLYLGTRENGVYRSCSQGEHWYKLEDEKGVFSK